MKTGMVVTAGLAALAAAPVQAQIGSGWTQYTPSKTLQKYTGSYYSNVNGVETFRISGDARRTEFQLGPKWTGSQTRQFQGEVRCRSGSNSSSIQQVMQDGDPDRVASQLRIYSSNSGSMKVLLWGGSQPTVLSGGAYGNWVRVNVIHSGGKSQVYINGSLKLTGPRVSAPSFYFKYGIYMHPENNPQSEWRGIKTFRK